MSLTELQELVMDREAWCDVIHRVAKSRTRLSDWTELKWLLSLALPWFGFRSSNRKGTQLSPSTENWIKDLLSMASPIRIRPQFPSSQSLSSGSFHKPLILLHQRANRMKATIKEKKASWLHGSQSCLTQRNYEPCHVGLPKTDGSWWRVLTKHSPLEKGMANHFSILALRTPWRVWKGKNIGHWKINSPGW